MRNPKTFGFESALRALKNGLLVSRLGWVDEDSYLYLVDGSQFRVNRPPLNKLLPEGTPVWYASYIDCGRADGSFHVWTPTQLDVLGEDWVIYQGEVSLPGNVELGVRKE